MNQPTLTAEQITQLERTAFDSLASITAAIGHGLVLAFGVQSMNERPELTLFFPGEQEEDPQRKLTFTIPTDGQTPLQLITKAGGLCHGLLQRLFKEQAAARDYHDMKKMIDRVRAANEKRIIVPSRS